MGSRIIKPPHLCAIVGGIAVGLATPPTDIYPLMFVGLGLLGWSLRGAKLKRQGALRGALWAAAAGLVGLRFVPSVIMLFTSLGTALALLAHVLLSFAQSLHWAIGMAVAVWLQRRFKIALELATGAGVLIALSIPSVFVWSPAGLLSAWVELVQGAEFIGERGVSLIFVVLSVAALRGLHTGWGALSTDGPRAALRAAAPTWLAITALGAMYIAGSAAMEVYPEEAGPHKVALIHAGVHPKERWKPVNWARILKTLQTQTDLAERAGAELSIWPEAAYPYRLRHDTKKGPRGARNPAGTRGSGLLKKPILFGFISLDEPTTTNDGVMIRNRFNSASIIDAAGHMQPSYDKMELLWFGETVPLSQYVPALGRLFQRSGGLIPGTRLRALSYLPPGAVSDADGWRLGVLNCYEDTLPDLGRKIGAELQPDLLINVTNDAWFVGTEEPTLHLRLSVMRSIELRRDMLRAVNLGVAAWVDAGGRIRTQSSAEQPGVLMTQPTPRRGLVTFYARFGDLPSWLALLSAALFHDLHRRRKRALACSC